MSESDLESAFASMSALRAEHRRLQKLYRDDASTAFDPIEAFIRRGRATGAILDSESDQAAAQSLLDFWATTLYRAGRPVPESTLVAFDPALAPTLDETAVPYVGLDSFAEQEKDLFFGRRRAVDNIVLRLQQDNLIAVIGPSGSGKSSLVLAGVVPALKAGALPGSDGWAYLGRMVPGSDALRSLVRLLSGSGRDSAWVSNQVERLRREPQDIVALVEECWPSQPTVLVIDQFEELSTLSEDPASRLAFENALVHLVSAGTTRRIVLLSMRSDFIGSVALQPALQEALETALEHVTPLTASELREAIERPAHRIGLKFEQGVVENLVHDILGEPAALPLLQFTLLKLWERRQHNRVTLETYRELGGGRLALTHSADAFMAGLIPQDRVMAERIFLHLVRPGTGQDNVSNRVHRRALYAIGPQEHVDRVLDKLVEARLVRLTGDTDADTEVEVAHEALVRNWIYLVKLLEREREESKTRVRLEAKAAEWVRLGRGEAGLLKSLALAEGEEWIAGTESRTYMSDNLRALVLASRTAADAADRRQRRVKRTLIGLTTAALTLAGFAMWSMVRARDYFDRLSDLQRMEVTRRLVEGERQWAEAEAARTRADEARRVAEETAEAERRAADAEKRAAEQARFWFDQELKAADARARRDEADGLGRSASDALSDDPERATLLALQGALLLEAFDQQVPSNVQSVLYQARQRNRARVTVPSSFGESALAFSPDSRRLATGSASRPVRIWDATTGGLLFSIPGASARAAAFSWDNRQLALATAKGTVQLFETTKGSLIRALPDRVENLRRLTFSPDGRFLAGVGSDQRLVIWDVQGGDASKPFRVIPQAHNQEILAAAFSPTGAFLATGGEDNVIKVWVLETGELLATLRGHEGAVNDVAFHQDGRRLVSASDDRTVRIWVLVPDSGRDTDYDVGRLALSAQARSITVMPDGLGLLAVSADATVTAVDINVNRLSAAERFTVPAPDAGTFSVSPDGAMLATGGEARGVRLWDVESGGGVILGSRSRPFVRLVSTANGGLLTSDDRGTIATWDLTRTGRELVGTFDTPGGRAMAFTPDGMRAAVPSCPKPEPCGIRIYSVADRRLERTIPDLAAPPQLVFSGDGLTLLSVSPDRTAVRFWEVSTGRELNAAIPMSKDISALAFSPDNRRLAVARNNATVEIWGWNGAQLSPPTTLQSPARVTSVTFAPDSHSLAAATADRIVRVWQLDPGGEPPAPLELSGHTSTIRSLAFNADGRLLVTGGDDKTARVWDLHAAATPDLLTINVGPAAVAGVGFTRDSSSILAAAADGTLRLFDVPGSSLVPLTLTTLTRPFGKDECRSVTMCEQLPAAVASVVEGNRLAALGDERGAAAKYEAARQLVPSIDDGERLVRDLASRVRARALRQETRGTLVQIERLALANRTDDARALATRLPAGLAGDISGFADGARKSVTATYDSLARQAANRGERARTQELLDLAVKADPSRKIDVTQETTRLMNDAQADQAYLLVQSGNVEEALEALERARSGGAVKTVFDRDDEAANILCWRGSLGRLELAKHPEVRKACEAAVELTKNANTNNIDSRGLNRARNGEIRGAIEDFRRYAEDGTKALASRQQREEWIALLEKCAELKKCDNPFPDELLASLR